MPLRMAIGGFLPFLAMNRKNTTLMRKDHNAKASFSVKTSSAGRPVLIKCAQEVGYTRHLIPLIANLGVRPMPGSDRKEPQAEGVLCRARHKRHTFASLLLQNGESPQYVKEQMGHSSIKVTVDVYGHLVPGSNRQAVNRLPTSADGHGEERQQGILG